MIELYDTVYPSKLPLIDGLLYTGTPLWDYTVRKGTVLYLALEDDYCRLQERLYRMFGTDSTDNLFFSVSADSLGNGLDAQLQRFMQEHTDTRQGVTEQLKAENQLLWVQKINNIRACVQEVVEREIIYS